MTLRVEIGEHVPYRGFSLLDVQFEVSRGEVVGIVGPNGSGKSTLCSLLVDESLTGRGALLWDGDPVHTRAPHARPFAYKPQAAALFEHLSVWDNVLIGPRIAGREEGARPTAERLLKQLGLERVLRRPAAALSGGEKQRVALARALVDERPVSVLDEPFAGVDAQARARTQQVLAAEVKRRQLAVVLVTHELESLSLLGGERCVVLERGRMVGERDPRAMLTGPSSSFEARLAGFRNIVPLLDSPLGKELRLRCVGPVPRRHETGAVLVSALIPEDAISFEEPVAGREEHLIAESEIAGLLSAEGGEEFVLLIGGESVFTSQPRGASARLRLGDRLSVFVDLRRVSILRS